MYGDSQLHPTLNSIGGAQATTGIGITIKQHMAVTFTAAMLSNPHYAPMTVDEIAKKAIDAANALLTKL